MRFCSPPATSRALAAGRRVDDDGPAQLERARTARAPPRRSRCGRGAARSARGRRRAQRVREPPSSCWLWPAVRTRRPCRAGVHLVGAEVRVVAAEPSAACAGARVLGAQPRRAAARARRVAHGEARRGARLVAHAHLEPPARGIVHGSPFVRASTRGVLGGDAPPGAVRQARAPRAAMPFAPGCGLLLGDLLQCRRARTRPRALGGGRTSCTSRPGARCSRSRRRQPVEPHGERYVAAGAGASRRWNGSERSRLGGRSASRWCSRWWPRGSRGSRRRLGVGGVERAVAEREAGMAIAGGRRRSARSRLRVPPWPSGLPSRSKLEPPSAAIVIESKCSPSAAMAAPRFSTPFAASRARRACRCTRTPAAPAPWRIASGRHRLRDVRRASRAGGFERASVRAQRGADRLARSCRAGSKEVERDERAVGLEHRRIPIRAPADRDLAAVCFSGSAARVDGRDQRV